ncbi:hypothetical protein H310_13434 [Aphanomyces invadans]|uniref:Uncharacterized protein n=1 Tax=Aphanomyces invadans TaxID=157072 RepID=A0A024TDV4_9STRA|nr:hypothetical protein H310_13434 [Aphanomyces invadans]ETV92194.1 hypothetical protein H310_13434 [Aphanomyces invadans]|eukprot:XP_008879158.1 hypothetical protein H310_13434 [Aphanomyces invadans]
MSAAEVFGRRFRVFELPNACFEFFLQIQRHEAFAHEFILEFRAQEVVVCKRIVESGVCRFQRSHFQAQRALGLTAPRQLLHKLEGVARVVVGFNRCMRSTVLVENALQSCMHGDTDRVDDGDQRDRSIRRDTYIIMRCIVVG